MSINKASAVITVAVMLILTKAYSQPSVSGVSGTLVHGGTVTIIGSGFGTKNPANPLIWANFEGGSINPTNLGVYTTWSDPSYWAITNINQPANSTYVAFGEYNWGLNKKGPSFGITYDYFQKVYVFLKRYRDYGYYSTINQKFFRIWPQSSTNDFLAEYLGGGNPNMVGRCYTENTNEVYNCSPNCPGNSYQGSCFTEDTWETEEFQWSQNSAIDADDGTWRFWRDGVIIQTRNNLEGRSSAQSGNIVRLYIDNFSGGVSTNMPPDGSKVYVDDVYIDNTWSRIIIGNQNSLSGSTHNEIQIPSAWTDTSATVTINQGLLTSGTTAYIYVVDSDGNVNASGYPVTMGSTLTPADATPPAKPKGLRMKIK